MPSMPIRVLTVYFVPPKLNLGTQYNSMLLNWHQKKTQKPCSDGRISQLEATL